MSWFHGIQARLAISFGLAVVVILVTVECIEFFGLPGLPSLGWVQNFKSEASRSLELIADLKEERLRSWIKERCNDLDVWANPHRIAETEASLETFERLTAKNMRGEALWRQLRGLPEYAELSGLLNRIKADFPDYSRIFIVDARSGKIFASSNQADLGLDVGKEAFFSEQVPRAPAAIRSAMCVWCLACRIPFFTSVRPCEMCGEK